MTIPLLLMALALSGLAVFASYIVGHRQGEKSVRGDFSSGEIESFAKLLDGMARLASASTKEDDLYHEGLTRILKANTKTVRKEIIVDIKHGEIVFTYPENLEVDWVYHALTLLQEQNPFWVEQDERLLRALKAENTSPLMMAIEDGSVTRLIVLHFPQYPDDKKAAVALFIQQLNEVVADIRARSLSASYYERIAQRLQESNTRMKQLFSNVRHNLGNTLSGVMTGLGTIKVLTSREPVDTDRVMKLLSDTILPNYEVSNQMVSQMYSSIAAIVEEQQKHDLQNYRLNDLFERYFGTWLKEQRRRLSVDIDLTWHIPDDLYIRTSDLVFFQATWNVLKNAIKYTEEGSIRLSTFPGDDDRIYLQVKDTGPGIPKEIQHNIGQYGYRGEQEGKAAGEGIGLWGSYQLVEAIDGNIYFRSQPGSGTEFNIGFLKGEA